MRWMTNRILSCLPERSEPHYRRPSGAPKTHGGVPENRQRTEVKVKAIHFMPGEHGASLDNCAASRRGMAPP